MIRPKPKHPRDAGITWRNGWAYLWVRGKAGRKRIACHTKDAQTARRYKALVAALRMRHEWDVVEAVRDGACTLHELASADAGGVAGMAALRAKLADVALPPHVGPWLTVAQANGLTAQTAGLYRQQVTDWLAAHPNRSHLTASAVRAWLAGLTMTPGTRRGYWYALKAFCGYLRTVHVLTTDPLEGHEAPKANKARTRHETEATDRAIVEAAPAKWQALFAFIHATGAEVSAALMARVGDLDLVRGIAHVRGTKTEDRDRPTAIIEAWALPYLAQATAGKRATDRIWPGLTRQKAADAHRTARAKVGVPDYSLRDARHSVTVRRLKGGATFHDAAVQLGHSDTALVHKTYGRFIPELDGRLARFRGNATASTDASTPTTRGTDD